MRGIEMAGFGPPPQVLNLVTLSEPPAPGLGQVLLTMQYAPITPYDFYAVLGLLPSKTAYPAGAGVEGIASVLAVGPDVNHLQVGDRVLAPAFGQTWRERLLADAADLFALPFDADPRQLSMLGVGPPTATLMLEEFVDLRPGDWVVQNDADSLVGRAVIALAAARGVKTINLVRDPRLVDDLTAAGGDIVAIDTPGMIAQVAESLTGQTVRLGIDAVSGPSTVSLTHLLSEGGALVGYALASGQPMLVNMLELIAKRITVYGMFMGHPEFASAVMDGVLQALPLMQSGALRLPVAATYPLSQFKQAIAHAERGGKVLLDLGAEQ